MSTLAHERTELAHEMTGRFAALPAVEGVCLFGSLARGEPDEWSDIDLLVVGRDDDLRPTSLLRELPPRLRAERVSLVCYSTTELQALFEAGSSFVDHIRHEGLILYDRSGFLPRIFREQFEPHLNLAEELQSELKRLEIYEDISLFNGNFLFCLAQLYAIGKAVVILASLADGRQEYSRERAFSSFRSHHPALAAEVETVEKLRPFYRRVTRRQPEPLPFPYRGAESEVKRSIAAIRNIAAVLQ